MAKIDILGCKVIDKYEGNNSLEDIYINLISIKLSNDYEYIEGELKVEGEIIYEN